MSVFTEEYNEDSAQEWVKDRGNYLEFQEENIIVTDEDGVEWVCIYKYESISNELHKQNNKLMFDTNGAQQIYFEEIAYIVHKSEYNAFRDWCSDKNLREIRVPSRTSSTQIFNGEIPWSSSSKYYFDEQWEAINDIIEHKVQRKSKMPLFEDFYVDEFNFEKVINERVESDEVTISHVMPATINVGWENEYDASKEEPEYHSMPCPSMITHMNLHQGEQNGEFYSEKGEMIAFEEKDENEYNSVYIRLDELKKYLSKMNYRICWICCAEKHYYYGTQRNGQEWTDWRGFFELEDCKTVGCIKMI
jgi:hypothetical protein